MSRAQALLLALFGTGCAAGVTAIAVHRPSRSGDATSPGRSSAVASSTTSAPLPRRGPAPVTPPAILRRAYAKQAPLPPPERREATPGLGNARGWLNVTRPPVDADLRGRVVVVDFWTSCCINCMQALPTLAALEKKHAHDPFLVIGVHTQKFDAEPEPERLRDVTIRLGIEHPVAIDGDRGIWEAWGVTAWPTVVVLDTKGRVVWAAGGEPDAQELEAVIESALAEGAEQKTLATEGPTFLGREVDVGTPLAYPEKIAVIPGIPGGYAIADSGHDRVVLVDPRGRVTGVVGGGARGFVNGDFGSARFAHPQGIVAWNGLLYVADTENHAIRAIDPKTKTVRTVAGTGRLGHERLRGEVDGRTFSLRSPWDLAVVGDTLYVALAGSHQIAIVDPSPERPRVKLFAGTGAESLVDGARLGAAFAQPSGLATDGKALFVLDSETSAVRKIDLASGNVSTLVGKALFVWGDVDGEGSKARLQHPVGLAYGDGALWVADTYNSKVKRIDPSTGETTTVGDGGRRDSGNLFEPAGLTVGPRVNGATTLLIADTNHSRIARLSLGDGQTVPWDIEGLSAQVGPSR